VEVVDAEGVDDGQTTALELDGDMGETRTPELDGDTRRGGVDCETRTDGSDRAEVTDDTYSWTRISASSEPIRYFPVISTGSSTALSLVLGGLLDGLLGSMVRFGVGAAEPTSSCNGEAGAVETGPPDDGVARLRGAGESMPFNISAMACTCFPL
jgi:hypothetical protein